MEGNESKRRGFLGKLAAGAAGLVLLAGMAPPAHAGDWPWGGGGYGPGGLGFGPRGGPGLSVSIGTFPYNPGFGAGYYSRGYNGNVYNPGYGAGSFYSRGYNGGNYGPGYGGGYYGGGGYGHCRRPPPPPPCHYRGY